MLELLQLSGPFKSLIIIFPSISPRQHWRNQTRRKHAWVSINTYSAVRYFKRLSSKLNKIKHFLQHPDIMDSGINYDNPHYFKPRSNLVNLNELIKPLCHIQISKDTISSEVERVMNMLHNANSEYRYTPATDALRTPLKCWVKQASVPIPTNRRHAKGIRNMVWHSSAWKRTPGATILGWYILNNQEYSEFSGIASTAQSRYLFEDSKQSEKHKTGFLDHALEAYLRTIWALERYWQCWALSFILATTPFISCYPHILFPTMQITYTQPKQPWLWYPQRMRFVLF